jgi:hypothetical protein
MRNNNTFGTNYPTCSIGRYSTEELKEMKNKSDNSVIDTHKDELKSQTINHKNKEKSER